MRLTSILLAFALTYCLFPLAASGTRNAPELIDYDGNPKHRLCPDGTWGQGDQWVPPEGHLDRVWLTWNESMVSVHEQVTNLGARTLDVRSSEIIGVDIQWGEFPLPNSGLGVAIYLGNRSGWPPVFASMTVFDSAGVEQQVNVTAAFDWANSTVTMEFSREHLPDVLDGVWANAYVLEPDPTSLFRDWQSYFWDSLPDCGARPSVALD